MRFISKCRNSRIVTRTLAILITLVLVTASTMLYPNALKASSGYAMVVLSRYNCNLKIGQSFYLIGVASNGKRVTWKSSKSSIASVNTYGQVTAKKAGTCKITGRVSGGEASCNVTVEPTKITLSSTAVKLENGAVTRIKGSTSNGSAIIWKSQKSSVATVDVNGRIVAVKPGETYITAKADGSTAKCKVTVKKPIIALNMYSLSLYRGQSKVLKVTASSGRKVTFKSKKKSGAKVNANGLITAVKHGTAMIAVSLDGVTRECEVNVKSPTIKLSHTSVALKKGKTFALTANVSSGNSPVWKSSKPSVATVNQTGKVIAHKKGSCIIYVSEDGTKASCRIQVS